MVQASNLSKSFGERVLFEDVSFAIGSGERVGLVGRNGSGKSTLFRIILGQEDATDGRVSVPKGYRLGHLEQHISFSKETLLEECATALPEEFKYETYRAEKILFGLGFGEEDLGRNPNEFSGGYQLRINLTKCLLREPDLLLLDEPTNYLDILSLRWMARFLKSFPGEILLITHDRHFMDAIVSHTMGIHRGQVRKVKGGTKKYYEQLQMDEEIHEKTRVNREKKIKQMQEFVDRFRAKASKATQAQSMIKKIEKMGALDELSEEQVLGFKFHFKKSPAKTYWTVKDLSFGFEADNPLFSGLNFDLKPKDCIGIIGRNGKGKTTLLNVLAHRLKPLHGEIKAHPSNEVGYYQQTNKKDLNPKLTVADEIGAANVNLDTSQVRGICGAMMFSGEDADKKIKVLSGGEKSRVLLGKVLAHENNVLLLDEPSNHLDMESIEVLTEQIARFPGGVMIVTHNEDMLNHLCNKLIVFSDGRAELFNGAYQEFLKKRGWDDEDSVGKTGTETKSIDRKELKRQRAEIVKKRSKELKPLKQKIAQVEESISANEKKLAELNKKVEDALATGESIQDVYKEIGQIQIAIESDFEKFEKMTCELDRKKKEFDQQLDRLS